MKNIFQIQLILLMLLTSGIAYAGHSVVYHPPEKQAVYLSKTDKAEIVGDLEGLSAQLLDNIDDDTRSKIQLAALVSAGPEIGIFIKDAVSATRKLRTKYPTYNPAILSANEVRLALAQRDLVGFDAAWDFVRSHPRGADAWEVLIETEEYRRNVRYLENTDDYLIRTGSTNDEFLDEFNQFTDSKNIFLDELADTPSSGLYSSFPDGVWNLNPFRRGREIEMALSSNLHTNFPWVDKFDELTGVATSIKSTDTYAMSYQNLDNLESLWKGYVNNLASMPPPNVAIEFAGDIVIGYNKQVLEIAIPSPLLGGQNAVKANLIEYAKFKGYNGTDIEIIITVIE